ncbi:RNA-binding protein 33-like isoform X2 [Cimex lectularius]|uniref:RRM domain-containing protein n=1 Tax=Cimex lectularius TaxID=79782 RepID=A0A8I6S483_CIMLE|nr:RNA-binding protein 33-like isoform X2 [Cimex lectularius]
MATASSLRPAVPDFRPVGEKGKQHFFVYGMAEIFDDILDDDMGEMGDMADMGFEFDLDEDALLADDEEKSTSQSRAVDHKAIEDEDFIEIGIEDDISDDLKNDVSENKKAQAVTSEERNDSDEGNKERSRFKAERNIVSGPRTTNTIPETLDAVPVKTNYQPNNQSRGKGPNRQFRGGARGRHKGGSNGPPPGMHPSPYQHPGPPPMSHQPHPHPHPQPHQPQFSSGNIHVNPHFRNNLNLPGAAAMWNGWNHQDLLPRPAAPHQPYQEPNYGNQRWNDNPPGDYHYQQGYQEHEYYNGGPNDQYYQPGYNNGPPGPPPMQGGWNQQYYSQQEDYNQPPYQPMEQQPPYGRNAGPNFPPQHFHGPPPQVPPHHMMPPHPRFGNPKMNKFRNMPMRGGIVKPILPHGIKPNTKQIRENYHQNKVALKQQRFDVLRKVTISNLHEVQMVDCQPKKVQKIEPEEEDEEMKAYRLKIEEQKKLREALLKQKEEKRKVAAQQKSQLLEAGVSSSEIEGKKSDGSAEESEFKVVRVRTPDGKTILKKLTLAQISKLKKVTPSPAKSENGVDSTAVKAEVKSRIVAIDNLSASTTKRQIEAMAKQVGAYESVSVDAESKRAVIKFANEESALLFKTRNQRKMVDLSMITVHLMAPDNEPK